MNGHDAHVEFCVSLLEVVGPLVASLGEEKAVSLLKASMARDVTSGEMTLDSGAFVVQKSPRQLHDHKYPLTKDGNKASLWSSLFDVLSPTEWQTAVQLLARIAERHRTLALADLERVLDYFVGRHRLEKNGSGGYRLRPFMLCESEDVMERLDRAKRCLETMLSASDGYTLERSIAKLKAIDLEGGPEDLEHFFAFLYKVIEQYWRDHPPVGNQRFRVAIAADRVTKVIAPKGKGEKNGT